MMAGETPATVETPPAPLSGGRRVVAPDFSKSAHAQKAIAGMNAFGSPPAGNNPAEPSEDVLPTDRYEPAYPLFNLKPSPSNPRRLSLDAAGVTMETILKFRKKPEESIDAWLARQDAWLEELRKRNEPTGNIVTWELLFDLALSTMAEGLIQAIVARPDGEIIAGERRYTACLLAGHDTVRVLIRQIDADLEAIYRLIENIQREDLNVAETCIGVRELMKRLTGAPLGPDNDKLTINLIQDQVRCKQTKAYYFYIICQLPDDDEQVERLQTGYYSSLRTAYEETSQYLKALKRRKLGASTGGQQDTGVTPPPTPAPKKPSVPVVKMPVPGKASGVVIIKALAAINDLSDKATGALKSLEKEWDSLTDKKRREKLGEAFAAIVDGLAGLDTEKEGNA
ncbi:TPA: ParB/RepB/Spo0J family partition protein [Pseudomonas aeruginosa]|uniref:ParB/RepB/Spo0J family partition protein n=1 Tax=Pseudomonas aeruginosa TaxID=287 RepID=UPI0027FFE1C8|nr:ParB N-terminal domain-containing protein [Pseudomonas aeruginosa]ELJ2278763.1 ParB N-terminal domain-containing protein [Pseudomonas aeruginosa]MCS8413191.1 ParB N-terminal domain-containing protein [Pseudomonas aeruginosa]MCS9764121.1 ParB N-terminal domain-containing protein [Pseudomonas aeruginosa]MCS9820298.1 ParB N-terminal domain-containing protein [Pseudomonas aeruginosa]